MHSLKSPIFAITGELEGFIDLAKEYEESSGDKTVSDDDNREIVKEMKEWLSKMREQMEQISDAITAIKSQIVVLNNDEKTSFTVEDLVKYVEILMKNTLKQKLIILNFIIKVPQKTTEIKGNFNSLVQVINNLILNSIDSYEGKTNQIIEIVIYKEKNNLIISVIDNGKGIPKSIQNKIFKEIIYSSEEKNGLSLFVSYSNIKAGFGGEMSFESSKKGTVFNIIIPIETKEEGVNTWG